jgi:hypothetical protein
MIQVSAILRNHRDVAAWDNFLRVYLSSDEDPGVPVAQMHVEDRQAKKKAIAASEKPTPLEQAIDEKKAAQDVQPEESAADPFAQLLDQTPTAAELGNPQQKLAEPEKKLVRRKPKAETAPVADVEPAKPEDKELTLDDIRKASTVALELVGAPTIQEALAKFNAVDDKNVLRMSALRPQDYALYVQYLKKKVNDAAKEWPNA